MFHDILSKILRAEAHHASPPINNTIIIIRFVLQANKYVVT